MHRQPRRSWMFQSINVIAWTIGLLALLATLGVVAMTAGAAK